MKKLLIGDAVVRERWYLLLVERGGGFDSLLFHSLANTHLLDDKIISWVDFCVWTLTDVLNALITKTNDNFS